jgi:hypothetical protein
MKRSKLKLQSKHTYIIVGLFLLIIQFIRILLIDNSVIPANESYYLQLMILLLVTLPILLYILIYIPSAVICKVPFLIIPHYRVQFRYTAIVQTIVIQYQINRKSNQSSLQVFRC